MHIVMINIVVCKMKVVTPTTFRIFFCYLIKSDANLEYFSKQLHFLVYFSKFCCLKIVL